MMMKLLICWMIFVILVYGLMWYDVLHYQYNLSAFYKKILDAFTEEE